MYIHRSVSASIGKRQQFFHWKTPGAGGGIAYSATVEGNFRVPATRQATNKMADAMSSGRNLPTKYRTFALSQCYTAVLTLYDYTILYDSIRRKSTASYSYVEMFTSLLRDNRMKNRRDRAPFIPSRHGGVAGIPESSSSCRVHMYLAFYRLLL